MKVVLTGVSGQLGLCIQKLCPLHIELILLGRKQLDLSHPEVIAEKLNEIDFDAIINAGAYTAVDKAEREKELAFTINAEAVKQLALAAQKKDAKFIHISTDYVFNGMQSTPYKVTDKPAPINVYGESKLLGEQHALEACDNINIVRTSWVYSEYGTNFVKTMLRLAKERDEISVVCDQIGSPTYAGNLAEVILLLLDSDKSEKILHYTDAGVASWYDFAVAIFELSQDKGLISVEPKVIPILAKEYITVPRPNYSVLEKTAWLQSKDCYYWRKTLKSVIQKIGSQSEAI